MFVVLEKRKMQQIGLLLVLAVAVWCLWLVSRQEGSLRLVDNSAATLATTATPADLAAPVATTAATGTTASATTAADILGEYRLERDRARSAQLELLRSAADDDDLSAEHRRQLQDELIQLMQKSEQEAQVEALLAAGGYQRPVVVLTKSGATVVLLGILTKEDAMRIGELVARVCSISQENVTIMDAVGQN